MPLNNCGCLGSNPTPTPTPVPCPDNSCTDCMIAASPLIQPADSVGPCSHSGQVLLSALNNYTICTGAVKHQIIDFDPIGFDSVTINEGTGDVTFVTGVNAVAREYYDITYKVMCTIENIGRFGIIRVGMKDVCTLLMCAPNEDCNRCTELCEEKQVNLSVSVDSDQIASTITANLAVSSDTGGNTGANLIVSIDAEQ